jgi:acyl carrier protein
MTMTRDEFLKEMQDVLQTETELTSNTVLSDLEEWDSLSIMATMAFLDKKFGLKLKLNDFKSMRVLADIMEKVGI